MEQNIDTIYIYKGLYVLLMTNLTLPMNMWFTISLICKQIRCQSLYQVQVSSVCSASSCSNLSVKNISLPPQCSS